MPSGIPEPEEIILTKDYVSRCIPEDAIQDIVKEIKKECLISQDCNDVVNEIELTEKSISNGLRKYFTWLWCVYSQISQAQSTTENAVSIERKNWTGHTKNIHELYRSKQILLKWKSCLLFDNIAVSNEDIDIGGKHRKAAIVFARVTYGIYIHHQAKVSKEIFFNDPSNFKEGPCEFVTSEAKGKVRDISGWVISEETKSCIAYINSHKGTKSQSIMEKVSLFRKLKMLLDSMSQTQQETVENTEHPQTLDHILTYDRGAKTHVSDAVFDFFIDLASFSVVTFSEKNLHQYKENALSMAYSSVKGNASLQRKFQDLVIKCKKRSGFSSEQPELNNVTEKSADIGDMDQGTDDCALVNTDVTSVDNIGDAEQYTDDCALVTTDKTSVDTIGDMERDTDDNTLITTGTVVSNIGDMEQDTDDRTPTINGKSN